MLAELALTAIYLGGAGADDCDQIAFDPAGFAYLACHSNSENFTGPEKKDMDAYVLKLDPRTREILYKTRIGGRNWDAAFRLIVLPDGTVWVSGSTQSTDLTFDTSHFRPAAINGFLAHLNPAGNVDHLARIGDATTEGLAIAANGNIYLSGTKSPDSESHSAYIAEIAKTHEARILTLGPGTASSLVLDKHGSLYATGFTNHGAFIAKIDVTQWKQTAFRTIGAAPNDRARAIVLDHKGNPHIYGTLTSPNAKADAFLAGFDKNLRQLRYTTRYGGAADELAGFNGTTLITDKKHNLWIAGLTRSTDLPAQGKFSGLDDAFLASFRPNSSRPHAATYFGGTGFEMLEGLALAPDGAIWATGLTSSKGLATPDHHGGRTDAILLRATLATKDAHRRNAVPGSRNAPSSPTPGALLPPRRNPQ
ncbi:MAG: hypothetical protein JST93_18420 [Acidobacteria bacterium]|nr:hypothetical protein [Acidobacteriota bacterium]